MPDQQPLPLAINPIHATSFSVNVPFYANQVDVNVVLRQLQEAVEQLRGQVQELQEKVERLGG